MAWYCKVTQRTRKWQNFLVFRKLIIFIAVIRTGQPTFYAGGAYSIATEVFPNRWPNGELTNAYLTTLAVSKLSLLPQRNLLIRVC